jgi:caffeoyl-CoA O-methyltransferase/O-methyltransferase
MRSKNAVWDSEELASIQNKDRMLPSQPYFSKMYNGNDFYGSMERLVSSVCEKPNWDIKTKDGVTYAVLGSDLNTLRFYQFLIHLKRYKKVLELGTYIGVSAMYMADAGAHVTTVEMGKEFFSIAQENVITNGFHKKIDLCNGDAIKFLEKNKGLYDLILIDCAKEYYRELLELSLPRLSSNGIILVDDVFFQGDTLNNSPTSEKGIGVRNMLDYVTTLEGYEKVILPLGNGLLLVQKFPLDTNCR